MLTGEDGASAATTIQQWYSARMEYFFSRLMIRLLRKSTATGQNVEEEEDHMNDVLLFLHSTASPDQQNHINPVLLSMVRTRYLGYCQARARDDICVDTYQALVDALRACGRATTSAELQTSDQELKHMIETWERELVSPGFIQAKHEQQLRSNEVKQSVKNGNSDAYLRTMVDKGAFDYGFALQHFAKLRPDHANSKPKRKDTPAKQLLRRLSSRRFSINFRNAPATSQSTEIQIAHNIELPATATTEQSEAVPASPAKFVSTFASPFKRRGSVAFNLAANSVVTVAVADVDEAEDYSALLPFTDPRLGVNGDGDDSAAFRQFRMHSQFFYGVVHNCRKGEDVAPAVAQFLHQTQGAHSAALRTEVLYQILHDLGSRAAIRNESDENGEYVLVKHGVDGSEHVLGLLAVVLSYCTVPSDFAPYLLAFIVQRLGKSEDAVSERLFGLIRFDNNNNNAAVATWDEAQVVAKFAEFATLLPERPKMQVRKRVLETMRDTPTAAVKFAAAGGGVARQLFAQQQQPIAEEEKIELEEKDDEEVLPFIAPIRMADEERELRENFTVCQMLFDFNGEGGEQYLAVAKGDILWLSGLNSSKEWAKVYRREDQRVGWVPLSFVGYPGYE